ncbi:MAG: polyprenol phosphomannose-dependent alpha 1,6 mannosyltransferase MptB [Actinobacteria bacterium]|nr:polyprenol phosphomannose-dependent alpha 1,6 mannosyltransferase MptB [Actinomycetota bacterium]
MSLGHGWSFAPSVRTPAVVGLAGSLLLSGAAYWVGAVPLWFRRPGEPILSLMRIGSIPPRIAFYVGLGALIAAWLVLGRQLLGEPGRILWREVRRIGYLWLTPMVLAPPLGSRDVWAYAAQGQLVYHGLDPYTSGPSALPGAFADEVSARWVSTPAPYGPLWLLIGRGLAAIVGEHVTLTVVVLRLIAVAGLIMTAVGLPGLAAVAGGRIDVAMWLVIANPFVLYLGIGGGHNDMLMVGLMLVGLRLVVGCPTTSRLVIAAALIAAAAAVKSPAVVALPFAALLWIGAPFGREPVDWRRCVSATTVAIVTGAVIFALITLASGLGLGWVKQINSAAPIVNWMSVPSLLAILARAVIGHPHGASRVNPTMRGFRTAGTVLTLVTLPALWWVAIRRTTWAMLATALFLLVVLGPTVQPWYFIWSLAVAAALALRARTVVVFAAASIALTIMIEPGGRGFQMHPQVIGMIAGSAALCSYVFRSVLTPSPQRADALRA